MAFPPPVLGTARTNQTVQLDDHALNHNTANAAINDVVAHLAGFPVRMKAETLSATVSTAGSCVFTHTFGDTPDIVLWSMGSSNWSQSNLQGKSATTVTLRAFTANGTGAAVGQLLVAHVLMIDTTP